MPLVARLEHPRAGAGGDDIVAEKRAERSLEHVGVLVLLRMPMEWRGESARRERVMHDGEAPVASAPSIFQTMPSPPSSTLLTSVCRNRDSVELRAHGLSSFSVNIIVYWNGKLQAGCGGVNRSGASNGRKYELKERAESLNATRERIVEATVELHDTLGPARTTISAIAERAGVQRLHGLPSLS